MDKVIKKEIVEGITRVVWCPSRRGELAVERCVASVKQGRDDCQECNYRIKAQYSSLRIRRRIKLQDRGSERYYSRRKVFNGPKETEPEPNPPLPDIPGRREG